MSTLPGLFAAGNSIAGQNGGHPGAATTGRYAGRYAAVFARSQEAAEVNRAQIDAEKARVYQRIGNGGDVGWKELNSGTARVMQIFCGAYKSQRMMEVGQWWLNSIRESEAERTYVRNPHELERYIECLSRLTLSEVILEASLARKASNRTLDFTRLDYPEVDPEEWNKYITLKQEDGKTVTSDLSLGYYLEAPYADSFKANYDASANLNDGGSK